MAKAAKPIRYGKPCMTNLPGELGKSIIRTIMTPRHFDRTSLNKVCAQVEHRLAQIAEELKQNAVAPK